MKIDEKYDNIYFKEDTIKETERMPNKIKIDLENGKRINNEWNDEKKLKSIINDCINIEKNINNMKAINEKIKRYNISNANIKFYPDEEIRIMI